MKLIQFESKREVSRKAFESECKNDRKLRRLRFIEMAVFCLVILSILVFLNQLSAVWLSGTVGISIIDFLIIILIRKRRKRIRQPYIFLKR